MGGGEEEGEGEAVGDKACEIPMLFNLFGLLSAMLCFRLVFGNTSFTSLKHLHSPALEQFYSLSLGFLSSHESTDHASVARAIRPTVNALSSNSSQTVSAPTLHSAQTSPSHLPSWQRARCRSPAWRNILSPPYRAVSESLCRWRRLLPMSPSVW